MNKLDEVLDALMKSKEDIIAKNATDKDKNELISALREKIKAQIIDEIRIEYKNEIIKQADAEIKKKVNNEKEKQLKSLMWNGFAVAFIVGLAINQITELITFLKKLAPLNINILTLVLSIILIVIVVVLYLYQFIRDVIDTWNEIKKNKE